MSSETDKLLTIQYTKSSKQNSSYDINKNIKISNSGTSSSKNVYF